MEKENLLRLIDLGYSQRDLAKELNLSQSAIKYWLKKYEINTKYKIHNTDRYLIDGGKKCSKCKELKDISEFYKRTNREGYNGYCKKCDNEYHLNRLKGIKIKMLEYKGSKCVDCELHYKDSHYCVFDFHHLDPTIKDPNFKRIKFQSWNNIKKEIDKCVLLCSNCHRMRHAIIEKW